MKQKVTICDHCGGTGRCGCDECWNVDMFKPDYSQIPSLKWSRETAPCSVCGGRGRIETSESGQVPGDKK